MWSYRIIIIEVVLPSHHPSVDYFSIPACSAAFYSFHFIISCVCCALKENLFLVMTFSVCIVSIATDFNQCICFRLLEQMGVSSPDTKLEFTNEFYLVLACKPQWREPLWFEGGLTWWSQHIIHGHLCRLLESHLCTIKWMSLSSVEI